MSKGAGAHLRFSAALLKSAREMKTQTRWLEPNPDYEAAVDAFAHSVLSDPAIHALLEDTTEQAQIQNIEATIALAKHERERYTEGSYMHNLLSQDIAKQEEQLARYNEEIGSGNIEKVIGTYQRRIMDFLNFLNVMRGRYEQAA